MYGGGFWLTTKAKGRKLAVAEMRMLRWMCGMTRKSCEECIYLGDSLNWEVGEKVTGKWNEMGGKEVGMD